MTATTTRHTLTELFAFLLTPVTDAVYAETGRRMTVPQWGAILRNLAARALRALASRLESAPVRAPEVVATPDLPIPPAPVAAQTAPPVPVAPVAPAEWDAVETWARVPDLAPVRGSRTRAPRKTASKPAAPVAKAKPAKAPSKPAKPSKVASKVKPQPAPAKATAPAKRAKESKPATAVEKVTRERKAKSATASK